MSVAFHYSHEAQCRPLHRYQTFKCSCCFKKSVVTEFAAATQHCTALWTGKLENMWEFIITIDSGNLCFSNASVGLLDGEVFIWEFQKGIFSKLPCSYSRWSFPLLTARMIPEDRMPSFMPALLITSSWDRPEGKATDINFALCSFRSHL